MQPARIMIIDDSVVIRRMLSQMLDCEPDIDVVRAAPNGKIGLARIAVDKPDLVILDVEMPEMDGIQTLAEIRKSDPTLPVIMFSTTTERGASTTLEALSLGASDYLTKPSNTGASLGDVRSSLLEKIRGLTAQRASVPEPKPAVVESTTTPTRRLPPKPQTIEAVVIGVSTGGPNALAKVLPAFPGDFPVPILIVQHMPAMFTKLLAERLDKASELRVDEGRAGQPFHPGEVWIAPGDFHMTIRRTGQATTLDLNQEAQENSCRPAVDVLFRSAVSIWGPATLGVVLTGMGQDGLVGCQAIADAGGQVIAQDEATSVVWGMPGAVAGAQLAETLLPLDEVAAEVCRRVQRGRTWTGSARPTTAGSSR